MSRLAIDNVLPLIMRYRCLVSLIGLYQDKEAAAFAPGVQQKPA